MTVKVTGRPRNVEREVRPLAAAIEEFLHCHAGSDAERTLAVLWVLETRVAKMVKKMPGVPVPPELAEFQKLVGFWVGAHRAIVAQQGLRVRASLDEFRAGGQFGPSREE